MQFSKIFRIKEEKLETFKDWMEKLATSRKEEATATFAYENVVREMFILFKGSDGHDYVVGLNETSGPLRPGDSSVAINREHSAIKRECLESISEPGEILLDLEVPTAL